MNTSIAVVDDHRLVRDGLASACRATGRMDVVLETDNVAELLALQSMPEVILLDLDLNGAEVSDAEVEALLARGGRVLLVSATMKSHLVSRLLRLGVSGFVSKQDSTDALLEAIDAVASGEVWTTSELAAMIASDPERPSLSPQEVAVLQLYASGLKLESVARRMGIAPTTAREYINRIRSKYSAIGRPAPTKVDLHTRATQDGFLE